MIPAVGLTGGIGSGKSAVADRLAARGAIVVDADQVSRELTGPGGAALPAIEREFGSATIGPDGGLDRAAMRRRVFADAGERRRLEAILHPLIRAECVRRLGTARGPYAVLVVPLFFESDAWARRVDRVVVVDCPEAVQVERTAARSGLAPDEVRSIMAAQWPRWRRLQAADLVIWNGGDLAELDPRCDALDRALRHA